MTVATGVACLCVAGLIVVLMAPSSAVGWADVAATWQAQPWVRGQVVFPGDNEGEMWISPHRQIWAFNLNGTLYFYDGEQRTKYEYHRSDRQITKLPLGSDDVQKALPLGALSDNKPTIGPWLFGTEKIVAQERREVVDAGRTWIDFRLTLWRGARNHAVLRVDPQTRLPVYLTAASSEESKNAYKWEFSYPTEGPTDIYALGAPRDLPVVDCMPATDAQQVLDRMAATRSRIGDFRLIIGRPAGLVIGGANDDCLPTTIVSRKGSRWRVEQREITSQVEPATARPADGDWAKWLSEEAQRHSFVPQIICDGTAVWENSERRAGHVGQWQRSGTTGPQDLLSGEDRLGNLPSAPDVKIASLVYPDLTPKRGWQFAFDAAPADAPGYVLIKRSARLAMAEPMVGHEWYYIDPAKGCAVVRIELFNLPPRAAVHPTAADTRNTIRFEGFASSPQGFWYPTVVSTESISPKPQGVQEYRKTVRYAFDFAPTLPDDLFVVGSHP
ncbi:MAG TPA: hypothetical protein VGN12_15110 [Pirellulales bacterium]